MLSTLAVATRTAAPHVGRAAVAGGKALVGFAVTTKVGAWSKNQGYNALHHVDDAVGDARAAVQERKQARENIEWSNVTAVKETA